MLPTTIRSPPALSDFITLADYQSHTPESFVHVKPILHLYLTGAKATIPRSQCGSLAIFPADEPQAETKDENEAGAGAAGEEAVEKTIDVFVSSHDFTIFSHETESGVSIPYPSISIHALKQINNVQAIWMQLDFADGGADDDDFQTVELTITPESSDAAPSLASQLYEAISSCSNLHPDPNDEEEELDDTDRIIFEDSAPHQAIEGFTGVLRGATDGSLPPPMPGSGGWITANNVHEYFDEDGNWIGGGDEEAEEELGEGAGRTRPRDELEKDEVNGDGQAEDPDNKRPRVD